MPTDIPTDFNLMTFSLKWTGVFYTYLIWRGEPISHFLEILIQMNEFTSCHTFTSIYLYSLKVLTVRLTAKSPWQDLIWLFLKYFSHLTYTFGGWGIASLKLTSPWVVNSIHFHYWLQTGHLNFFNMKLFIYYIGNNSEHL